jgi:DNA-binding CsgD family transcriptional regulator
MGKTSKEIAGLLFLSELTIKTHRKNISEKLGSKGLVDLIAKSFQIGKEKSKIFTRFAKIIQ